MNLMSLKRGLYLASALLPLFATAAHAVCIPDVFPPNYLQEQENAGGHTIKFHVGKTDRELVNRLKTTSIKNSSSYGSQQQAQGDIETALTANKVAINKWANAKRTSKRDWTSDVGHTVGRVAYRPPSLVHIVDSSKVLVVIKRTGPDKCYLLTSYPAL